MGQIQLRNVRKAFGVTEIIPGLDLDIDEGEFVVFVGPSGCGKSTLLRLIAGLEDVSGGVITIDGKDATETPPAKRGLAMVFQSYALYPHMTVAKNIGFPLKMAGWDKARIDAKVKEAARVLNLTDYLDRRPGELSGGQRQRVAIGRAIVREPKAFLFDEPLSNLDAALRVNMRLEISEMHVKLKTTMIYVTHDQVEAMTMADKIVVLHDGRIEQVGSPAHLYASPANRFVAGFIGSPKMNFIDGAEAARHGASSIGIRPEHLTVSRESGLWKGEVVVAEHLGSDTFLHVRVDGLEQLTSRAPGRIRRPLRRSGLADAPGRPGLSLRRRRPRGLMVKPSKAPRMAENLSLATLSRLPPAVSRPAYARADLTPGIVHFGVGNFHRGHMAVYLDKLFEAGRDRDWAIIGAGVTDYDTRMRTALEAQDWLTTVVEQAETRSTARVTGAMVGFLSPSDTAAILACLADPAIRIVSLTVTEGGYFIDSTTGAFDTNHPQIQADAAAPDAPRTVFGLILAGLRTRREKGTSPFTVMSCDNVPHNGVVTQNAVAGLADAIDPALAAWVRAEVAFPNGMVDRVVPATGDRERRLVAEQFGVGDAAPVFCEDFIQWVLEDHFSAGRPALEEVGVTFVADVTPFETMKLRILNGGHALIAYPAALLDLEFVHEALQHALIGGFLAKVAETEIIPVVPPVPGVDLHDYLALVQRRFANPKIGDTTRRLCLDGSNRQPKFIIPSIDDRLRAGHGIDGLALGTAFWCRYCVGTTESGQAIASNDPSWDRLQARARAAKDDPASWLAMRDIYGDLDQSPAFATTFASSLEAVWRDGTEAALRRYLAD